MKPLIAIIDYEMGNLHSVSKALEKAGARVQVTDSPFKIRSAAAVVLPGVGAFGEAAKRLRAKKLITPILDVLAKDKPFLGICLGLQLLFECSEENSSAKGLGFIKGKVLKFRLSRNSKLKVPHMGWNTVEMGPASSTKVLKKISDRNYFYFVHSYYPAPSDSKLVATRTHYGGQFCSSISRGKLFASQFHPEKSGDIGHRLLRNFVQEVASC